jgi:ribose-phosphate pyrophosphokinase
VSVSGGPATGASAAPGLASRRLVVPLPGSEVAAAAFALALDADLAVLETRRFPDGEQGLRLVDDPAGREAVVFGALAPPHEGALTLRILGDLLRELGACRIGLVLPYLPYMRQDARFRPGEAITSATFARVVSPAADFLVTCDPHLHRRASLDEIYAIPSRVVPAAPAIAQWIQEAVSDPFIVGPDEESAQWAQDVALRVGCPVRVCAKERRGDRDVHVALPSLEAVRGRTPVLVDDILSSGRTLAVAVRALREAGMAPPVCIAVHGVFADDAGPLLAAAGAARVVTCNTLPGPTAAIDVHADLAAATRSMFVDAGSRAAPRARPDGGA